MKGKFLYEFNQNVKTNDYINNIVKFELKKMKKGSVVYYVPINFELTSLSEEETFKCMVRDAKNIKKYDEWVNGVNSKDKEENEEQEANFTRREFYYNGFSRSFTIPENIDTNKIKADYKDGILNITLPKSKEARLSREIRIS